MKIWRVICIVTSFICLFLPQGTGSVQATGMVSITLDGIIIETDVPPFIDGNARTMVPVRLVSETLGCSVVWDGAEQRVNLSRPGTIVELWIGRQTAQVNETEVELDTGAVIKDGRTMVPLRFLAETFGLLVDWEQVSRTVVLKTPPPQTPPVEHTIEPRIATVSGNNVNIRSGPGTIHNRLTQVNQGTRITVMAEDGAWFQVAVPSGVIGWISGQFVDFSASGAVGDTSLRGEYAMPADATRSALIMKPSVNVRSGASVEYPVIAKVTLGQQLIITSERNSWLSVKLPDGRSGWIASWLVAVRYDNGIKETADRSVAGGLISRWSGGEHNITGELPVLVSMDVERSGNGILLKISANSTLALPASFRMDNPSRIVFDFPAQLGEEGPAPTLQVNHGSVTHFRLGQFNDHTVRVVADLQGSASYALSQSSDGRTIIIQIKPIDPLGQIIVIDPGHGALNVWGGSDPGAIGPTGLMERDVVRSISLQLGNILLNEGFTVIYTHEYNTGLSLDERALVGSISGAELLVSIHANASTNRSLAGTMTFYHAAGGNDQISARRSLAGFIQAELLNRLQREDKGVRQANFLVLRSCSIPAALVEVAFISNPTEEKLLADPAFQRKAAEAVALGIKRYLAAR